MPAFHRSCVAVLGTLLLAGCVHIFWRTDVVPLDPANPGEARHIASPVKVHLADGSTVVFEDGAHVSRAAVFGPGWHYPLLSDQRIRRDRVAMDSVVAFEAFEGTVLGASSVAVSIAATALTAAGVIVVLKAIFGSCPTVYADTGAGPVLQAEGFSYAIAPLFEHRDVDPLAVKPGADGAVRLELRNEALETHFINHVELLAIDHPANTRVLPDQSSRPVVVGATRPLSMARDRLGRDVSALLADADGNLFTSDDRVIASARADDIADWIDVAADDVPVGDSIAVVLRLRNSLLNTVLLYDEMLRAPNALEWLTSDLHRISGAIDLARWYTKSMGLHVLLPDAAGSFAQRPTTARLNDVGPLAFRDVAVVLPRPAGNGPVRLRLRFVVDNWRIDHVAIAPVAGRPVPRPLAVRRVLASRDGAFVPDTAAVRAIADADEQYLETRPGQRMLLEFAPHRASMELTTTHLIAWQGWYREWVRRDWVLEPSATPFTASDSTLLSALRRWQARKTDFERAFYSARVPVM